MPLITPRQFTALDGRTLYMADGPDATCKSLLARETPELAIADGEAYLRRTRTYIDGHWQIKSYDQIDLDGVES